MKPEEGIAYGLEPAVLSGVDVMLIVFVFRVIDVTEGYNRMRKSFPYLGSITISKFSQLFHSQKHFLSSECKRQTAFISQYKFDCANHISAFDQPMKYADLLILMLAGGRRFSHHSRLFPLLILGNRPRQTYTHQMNHCRALRF